jgi:serine/threonine protein kinase
VTLEYCSNSDLFELIKRIGHAEHAPKPFILGQGLSKHMIKKIAQALDHLHTKVGVAHLDMKIENILFDRDYNIKICDFGFSEGIQTRLYEPNGTQGYMAPEMLSSLSS